MVIEEKDYVVKPCKLAENRFDVSLLKTVKGKTGDREEMEVVAYGVSFVRAIEIVVEYRAMKDIETSVDLKAYGNIYILVMKDMLEKIESLFKDIKNAEKENVAKSTPMQEMQEGDETHPN